MDRIRIDMFRNGVWQVRAEGEVPGATADALAVEVAHYATGYPHRAFLGGRLIASAEPRGNGRIVTVRHDRV